MINYLSDMIVDMNKIEGIILNFDEAIVLSIVLYIVIESFKIVSLNKFKLTITSFLNNDIKINILLSIKYLIGLTGKILSSAIFLLGLFNANLFNVKAGDLFLFLLIGIIIKIIINLIIRFLEREKINRSI